ncbi:calcium-binding protein [Vibrio maerlii]|uniref:calcium-binding protein n=1 Tax=Vibrio maerlii TaxID=2231648 RepID=UPI000E3DD16C|nr:calcium-binding protein [Vibrio maerlii]
MSIFNRIFGTRSHDNERGTNEADIFVGKRGNDEFVGYNGDDFIFGGRGDDRLIGGRGDDLVAGGRGNDYVSGGLDNDWLFGGSGDDFIIDYSGNNFISGGRGNDTIVVGDGHNVLAGGFGSDTFVLTNRYAVGAADEPVSTNDIEIKAEILDFNIFQDKIVLDLGLDTNNDNARDSFATSQADFDISYNAQGWAVISSDEYNIELTLNGINSSYMSYAENNNIDIFSFS